MCQKGDAWESPIGRGTSGKSPKSPRFFGVRLGDGKKVPESPMESPDIWGRFRGVPKSPERRERVKF